MLHAMGTFWGLRQDVRSHLCGDISKNIAVLEAGTWNSLIRTWREAECSHGKTQAPLVDSGVKDQIFPFVCVLPIVFLLAGACVLSPVSAMHCWRPHNF